MKKHFILIVLFTSFVFLGETYSQCKVLLESIAGKYDGDCKKGKAHGEGVAVGEDTYKGEFKKGYPAGSGTYTWANGDIFVGSFKKGKKEGAGTLTVKDEDKVIKGFWKDDLYIGVDEFTYKIYSKDAGILSARFTRSNGVNEITFVFLKGGKVINPSSFSLIPMEGSFANVISNGRSKNVQSVAFPLRAKLSSGGNKMEFKINQPGSWKVELNIR